MKTLLTFIISEAVRNPERAMKLLHFIVKKHKEAPYPGGIKINRPGTKETRKISDHFFKNTDKYIKRTEDVPMHQIISDQNSLTVNHIERHLNDPGLAARISHNVQFVHHKDKHGNVHRIQIEGHHRRFVAELKGEPSMQDSTVWYRIGK